MTQSTGVCSVCSSAEFYGEDRESRGSTLLGLHARWTKRFDCGLTSPLCTARPTSLLQLQRYTSTTTKRENKSAYSSPTTQKEKGKKKYKRRIPYRYSKTTAKRKERGGNSKGYSEHKFSRCGEACDRVRMGDDFARLSRCTGRTIETVKKREREHIPSAVFFTRHATTMATRDRRRCRLAQIHKRVTLLPLLIHENPTSTRESADTERCHLVFSNRTHAHTHTRSHTQSSTHEQKHRVDGKGKNSASERVQGNHNKKGKGAQKPAGTLTHRHTNAYMHEKAVKTVSGTHDSESIRQHNVQHQHKKCVHKCDR